LPESLLDHDEETQGTAGEICCGDVDKEVITKPQNCVEHWLVLAPHDETASQANDGHVRAGFLTTNSPYGRKVKGEDFMKVLLFVGQLGI